MSVSWREKGQAVLVQGCGGNAAVSNAWPDNRSVKPGSCYTHTQAQQEQQDLRNRPHAHRHTHTNTDSAMKLRLLTQVVTCLLTAGKRDEHAKIVTYVPCLKHCEAKLWSTSVIFNIKVPFLVKRQSQYISFAMTEERRMRKFCSDLIGEIAVITGMLCNSPLRHFWIVNCVCFRCLVPLRK